MVSHNLTFRRYISEDAKKICELYDAVYDSRKADLCRRNWAWQYEDNPHNPGRPQIWVAEDAGRIIGLYATMPVLAKVGGERVQASWSTDLMTHTDYRGQGVFRQLTDMMLRECTAEGTSLFLVCPNQSSGPILRRRGWTDIKAIPVMVKALRVWPLLKKATIRSIPKLANGGLALAGRSLRGPAKPVAITSGRPLDIKEIRSFDRRFAGFFEDASQDHGFIGVRDDIYLNWRYIDCVQKKHTILAAEDGDEVLGYIVLAMDRDNLKSGHIVDILTKPCPRQNETIDRLLQKAIRHFKRKNATFVEICALESPYREILERRGFAVLSTGVFWSYELLACRPGGADGPADFSDIGTWFVTRGDADSDIMTN
jgi:GNAT superfamily N-acetyltransferase/predicted GNAT family N-acyltransferase